MASPQAAPAQLPVEQAQPQLPNGNGNGEAHVENGQEENGVAAVEQGMKELEVAGQAESGLHAACAEGRVDEVREILSRGVDNLETLGCTPIVLAIRNSHPDIVRELLQAGAIVPPPGVTNDQQMLSILYPPHMYGMAPFMHQQPHQPQQQQGEYYPQPPFYPPGPNGNGMYMPYPPQSHRQRKESDAGQGPRMDGVQPNLPPTEVAKTIPCRNFPNCKYGANCIFFHPSPNGFYGRPQPGYGYEGGFQGYPPQEMGFSQPGFQQFQQQALAPHPEVNGAEGVPSGEPEAGPVDQQQFQPPQPQPIPAPHHMNGMQPPFIPAFQQQQMPMSPPDFGGSPISPSMLGNSLPSIPPAEQFFAAASPPPAGFMGMMPPPFVPMPMGPPANRRQSFNQFGLPQPGGMPIPGAVNGGKMGFGHGKKASFSGGPRPPFAGARGLGADYNKWKDGMPPACIFYMQNKCRNGEMCKFPHLDAEGKDLRNPDVIRGAIPPNPNPNAPRLARPPRPFDPAFKQQQFAFLQQQRAVMQMKNAQASAGQAHSSSDEMSHSQILEATAEAAEPSTTPAPVTPLDKGASSLPPKPVTGAPPSTLAPAAPAALVRSASQPGIQRVHANGFNSRSQSPAPSNVSFHGAGHPKRNTSRPAFAPVMNGNGPRSSSVSADPKQAGIAAAKRNQRVPGADEFPALGGMGGESKQTSPVARGRTAAEVLSAPAPEKPVVKAAPAKEESEGSVKSDDRSIEMDSDNESDGVVISVKPSTPVSAPTPPPNGTASSKLPTMSFARMASGMSSPAETAPIAVKA